MSDAFYIDHLGADETNRLLRENELMAKRLSKSGLSETAIERRIHTDPSDPYERKSMASPYEILRIKKSCSYLLSTAFDRPEECHLVVLARAQDRVPIGELHAFNPDNIFRNFATGIERLEKLSAKDLKAFAVLEIQVVAGIDEPWFFEPHLHIIIQGQQPEQIRKAFLVRKYRDTTYRTCPLHIRPITNLERAIAYCTNLYPKEQVQLLRISGHIERIWHQNNMPRKQILEWCRCMSRFTPGEMVKFVRIDGSVLDRPQAHELSMDLPEGSRGQR